MPAQFEEISGKLKEFEKMYDNQPFEVVFKDILNGEIHWDEVDNISDYLEWEALVEDLQQMKKKMGIQ